MMKAKIAAAGRYAARAIATHLRDRAAVLVSGRQRSWMHRQHIAEFDDLLRLEDRIFADIGMTRDDVYALRAALLREPKQKRSFGVGAWPQPSSQSF